MKAGRPNSPAPGLGKEAIVYQTPCTGDDARSKLRPTPAARDSNLRLIAHYDACRSLRLISHYDARRSFRPVARYDACRGSRMVARHDACRSDARGWLVAGATATFTGTADGMGR